ncbi:MAG: hypothetical protein QM676_03415 [Novosphingobium sp.]
MGMDPYRIQAFIDVTGWLEWLIRRVSVLVIVLIVVGTILNLEKPGLIWQILAALAGLIVFNVFATGMRHLAQSFKS